MGQRVIRQGKLGLAKEYRDIFDILHEKKIISQDLSVHLKNMVGFRNVAIHLDKLKDIIEHRLDDLHHFGQILLKFSAKE